MHSHHRQPHSRTSLLLPLMLLTLACSAVSFRSQAEKVTVSLSQEQDGGEAGRACIYIYQGKAEYRRVKADEGCAPEIVVERDKK